MRKTFKPRRFLLLSILCLIETAPATGNERLKSLGENAWIALEPRPSTRQILQVREENSPTTEVTSSEPPFREYTAPAFGDGKLFYFGGGHSGYFGNDMEIYDPAENTWRQCYVPHCPPKDDSTYYSGGSERSFVDPATGACQPYVIHGYARTGYDPDRKLYVCTAMFPTKTEQDAKTGQWRLVEQKFSYIGFSAADNRWQLLAIMPDDLKAGATSLSYDPGLHAMLAFSERAAYKFADDAWQLLGSSDVPLAASGGASAVAVPDQQKHLIATLGHGGKDEVGRLAQFNLADARGSAGPALPADLQERIAAGTGGFNLILAVHPPTKRILFASAGEDKKPDVWLFVPQTSKWQRLPDSPSAPTLCNLFEPGRGRAPLVYDPVHDVFLLVERNGEATKMWAYRMPRE